ncbi:hypothetical protein VTI28DRAFT_2283 [Corynascus sepedonium]
MSKSRIIKPQEQLVPALKMLEQSDQPYIRHFWAYFCEASYYVKAQRRDHSDKFAPKAEKCRLIGYADLHGKIHWIWNPKIDTIVRASAVRFNEGPEFNLDDDVDTEYEAASTDTISEEEEDMVRKQQEEENFFDWFDAHEDIQDEIVVKMPDTTTQLPTPKTTPEVAPEPQPPFDKVQRQQLDDNDLNEIRGEAPIPPDHHLAP